MTRALSLHPTGRRLLSPLALGLPLLAGTLFAPAVRAGDEASVEGTLSKSEIRTVVRANIDDVRACYNAELTEDPALAGKSVARFTIGADGTVERATVSESTMPPRFDRCLAGSVQTWRFPEPRGEGRVIVSYPFVMEPG